MSAAGWDFSRLSTVRYDVRAYEAEGAVTSVHVEYSNAGIAVKYSETAETVHIDYPVQLNERGEEAAAVEISEKDGSLAIVESVEWEKNFFRPILIEGRCCIHSTFHKDLPASAEYSIVINPQMAFGTGHHATTSLILAELLDADLQGKSLLDMGCGTSVLAILASMRGASPVTAIDIDDWCIENSRTNIALNHLPNPINVLLGDASLLPGLPEQDIILANINRNILLRDMPAYACSLRPGGELWMSGFYVQDIPVLLEKASQTGLSYVSEREKDNWACLHLKLN